jgi:cobalt/nickel transport system permease protein
MKQWMIFFMGYGPTQLPLAVAEAVFTSAVLVAMLRRRPDLLANILNDKEIRTREKEAKLLQEKGA